MKPIRLATVFSGIGSVEFAMKRLGIPTKIIFACDNGERDISYDKEKEFEIVKSLDTPKSQQEYVLNLYNSKTRKHNFVKDTYLANYKIEDDMFFEDICLLDGSKFENKVDLFVGGSPCQSFSQVGFKKGLEDTRGTLFREFARLIQEIKPKVFLYENVRNMINHDKGNTWAIIKGVFDSLGYEIDFKILNAVDFGIPQKRNRLFVLGVRKDIGKKPVLPVSNNKDLMFSMQDFLLDNCGFGNFKYNKTNGELLLRKSNGKIDERYFLSEAVKKYVLSPGTKNWYQKVELNLPIARTLLKTMGNCHRGGVDNYVFTDGRIRMLTEREAFRLMGYTDDFKVVTSVAQAYKQAGNSIVVDVMMEILKEIFKQKLL